MFTQDIDIDTHTVQENTNLDMLLNRYVEHINPK